MTFEVTILGSSSASPAFQRNPSSQILNFDDHLFLIDCGEATQIQLARFKLKIHRINHIFISHLHGDHYLGLMGLLSTLHLQGRTTEMHIYCHAQLKEILDLEFRVSETSLNFQLVYHFHTVEDQIIMTEGNLEVETITLNHRIPCKGFLFREKIRMRTILKNRAEAHEIPFSAYRSIKMGEDYIDPAGKVIPNRELTVEPQPNRRYAYCSDTKYDERIIPKIEKVDLLYHETTFLHELLGRAEETFHTTCLQAGQIASRAKVKRLVIGHFSARYRDLDPLLAETKTMFENSHLAQEGTKFTLE